MGVLQSSHYQHGVKQNNSHIAAKTGGIGNDNAVHATRNQIDSTALFIAFGRLGSYDTAFHRDMDITKGDSTFTASKIHDFVHDTIEMIF